jgi:FKBP-type peptidyl-prolyl cis-trans isomerase
MKLSHLLVVILLGTFLTTACSQSNTDYSKEANLNTMVDTASYVIGYQTGNRLGSQGFPDVDTENFLAGMFAGLEGNDSEVPEEVLQEFFGRFNAFIRDKIKTDNRLEAEAFLAENRGKEGVQETPSGLQYKVLTPADGPSPTASDSVVVMYEGRLIDGTIFDTTYDNNIPAEFLLGGVIQGWIEGLQLMQVGSTYEFYIPSELAYGENPRPGGAIQPNHALIFKVELIDIK